MSATPRQPTRRDAVANRERIIDTAEVYFAQNGLDAPLQGLAAAAKVGAGTLYRNFASHDDIIRALYDRYSAYFDELAERALALESGWAGIELVLDECIDLLVSKGIVAEVMRRQVLRDPDHRPSDERIEPLRVMLQRAIEEGNARPDLVVSDFGAAALVLGGVQTIAPDHRPWISARMKLLLLDGMRAHPHGPSTLPEPPEDFDVSKGSIIRRQP